MTNRDSGVRSQTSVKVAGAADSLITKPPTSGESGARAGSGDGIVVEWQLRDLDALEDPTDGNEREQRSLAEQVAAWAEVLKEEKPVVEFQPVTQRIILGKDELAAFEVCGTRLALADVKGKIYAISDTCTYHYCSLAKGELAGITVTCPCHGCQFDVTTGAVLIGPASVPVDSYRVRVERGTVLVEI
jgi:nitrite reductase/ring-hydroxylating ferredoxin subunit